MEGGGVSRTLASQILGSSLGARLAPTLGERDPKRARWRSGDSSQPAVCRSKALVPGTSHRPGAASKAWPAAGALGSPRPATQTAGCRTDGKAFDPVAALVLSIPPGTEPLLEELQQPSAPLLVVRFWERDGSGETREATVRRGHRRPDYVPDVRERDLPADARGAALCSHRGGQYLAPVPPRLPGPPVGPRESTTGQRWDARERLRSAMGGREPEASRRHPPSWPVCRPASSKEAARTGRSSPLRFSELAAGYTPRSHRRPPP